MLEKTAEEGGRVIVTFSLSEEIWADHIALVGDFNDWGAEVQLLQQTREDGSWHISLELPAGRTYRFRYLIDDEEWMDDNHADGYLPNPFGGFDSVVRT
jgi:1,4-alpha-glucan branching enzyme